jgi:hypothetical protein
MMINCVRKCFQLNSREIHNPDFANYFLNALLHMQILTVVKM